MHTDSQFGKIKIWYNKIIKATFFLILILGTDM